MTVFDGLRNTPLVIASYADVFQCPSDAVTCLQNTFLSLLNRCIRLKNRVYSTGRRVSAEVRTLLRTR